MKEYQSNKIRNVAILGHSGSGKTEILESILFNQKVTDRFGKAVDGTSIIDSDSEEVRRGMSVYTHVVPVEYKDYKINFLDTPGYLDFAGEQACALAVADAAVVVVSAKDGVQPGAIKAYKACVKHNIPVLFFVTRVDEENADWNKAVADLTKRCKAELFVSPVMNGNKIESVTKAVSDELLEAIAMTDDALTEKLFAGEAFTAEEENTGISKGVKSGDIKLILCGSATKNVGINELLDAIVNYAPCYLEKESFKDANGLEVKTTSSESFSAFVFKTVTDNFAQASFVKVTSGTLAIDTPIYNSNKGENEKIGGLVLIRGKNQEKVNKLECGDIGAILKLSDTETNETLATKAKPIQLPSIEFPVGMLAKAIWPKTKNDEDKMSAGLNKLISEDKSIRLINNTETREQVIYGIGDQHIDLIVNKLKTRFKVEVELTKPTVQYRETIQGTSDVEGKHKKQSGGAGQYGDVWIKFEPNREQDEMVFETAVVGGAVSANYFPSVETGLRKSMEKGVLAGFKVVQVKATLHDGSMHPVDSKPIAFEAAAKLAFKKGIPEAKPCLLEPIIRAEVTIPGEYVGTIYGDFSKRRGMIMENNAIDDETSVIVAEVPQAEMMEYATELRSMTQGTGSYVSEFLRYERAPKEVADKVIANAKIEEDEED